MHKSGKDCLQQVGVIDRTDALSTKGLMVPRNNRAGRRVLVEMIYAETRAAKNHPAGKRLGEIIMS